MSGPTEENNPQWIGSPKKKTHEFAFETCCLCSCLSIASSWTGLQCCCCHINDGKTIVSLATQRYCTDVPCCLLLIITLAIQFSVFITAVTLNADPRWLLYYSDYNGSLCSPIGQNTSKYAAWPDIRIYDIRICVDDCNQTLTDSRMVTPSFDTDLSFANGTLTNITGYSTVLFLDAVCIPDPDTITSIIDATISEAYSSYSSSFNSVSDAVSQAINDVITAKWFFVLAAFSALLSAYLYGICLRKTADILIWFSLFLTIAALAVLSNFLIEKSYVASDFGYTTIGDIMYYTGIGIGILDGMFALAICFMWSRIKLAISLSKETSRGLGEIWQMFFYPIVPFTTFVIFVTYWCITGVYIGAVTVRKEKDFPTAALESYYYDGPTLYEKLGSPSPAVYVEREIQEKWQYALLFHFFVFLWILQFISYHTFMVISGAYAEWYFADWKDADETSKKRGTQPSELSPNPVLNSLWRTTRYHLGTIAFGSLLIAIIEFIEYTLTYLEKKFSHEEETPIQQCILNVVKCLLACLRCILDRINRNGLVITTIYGWPFCAASMKGLSLIFKNVIRATALSMVSGYLELLGKIAIVSFNTLLVVLIIHYSIGSQLTSYLLPGIIIAMISFAVGFQYIHLYEVGISTIFICFLVDEDHNKGTGYMRASKSLRQIVGDTTVPKQLIRDQTLSFRQDLINPREREYYSEKNLSVRELHNREGDQESLKILNVNPDQNPNDPKHEKNTTSTNLATSIELNKLEQ